VHVVPRTQQLNGSDCGVFAAAFLFQWVLLSSDTSLKINFDSPLMRMHLAQCLERESVIAFPSTREARKRVHVTIDKVQLRYV